MEYRHQSHSIYCCNYHIILPTKYRKKIFNEEVYAFFKVQMEIFKDMHPDIEVMEFNHDKDHIHLFVSIPPKYSVSSIVRLIKSNLGRELKQKFPFLKKCYYGTDGIWSDGYLASAVGINEKVVRKYIEMQGKEDMGRTMKLFE